jgi:hypothetical protein
MVQSRCATVFREVHKFNGHSHAVASACSLIRDSLNPGTTRLKARSCAAPRRGREISRAGNLAPVQRLSALFPQTDICD